MSGTPSLHFSLPFPDSHKMVAVAPGIVPMFMQDLGERCSARDVPLFFYHETKFSRPSS